MVLALADLLHHRGALQFAQDVGHRDVREHLVVPTGRTGVVAVVAAQVRVQPVGTAGARDHGKIGRRRAEPFFGILGIQRGGHRVADPVGREQQVVLDLLLGQAKIFEPAVAHVRGRMTVQAIVDERPGAALQRDLVLEIDRRAVQLRARFIGGRGQRRNQRNADEQSAKRFLENVFHQNVTLCGSGFSLSLRVYQGMRMKNRK